VVRQDFQIIHGGQSCFFFTRQQASLLFSSSSVWSAPPPERLSNSVLNASLCSRDPSPALLCEVGLSSPRPPHSQPLCFSPSLLSVGSSSWRLASYPAPALSICWFTCISLLRIWLLVPLPCLGKIQHSTPTLVLEYSSLFMFFSFSWGEGSVCQRAVLDYFPEVWVGECCVMFTCPFCRFMQAVLELASGEKWPTVFESGIVQEGFSRARGPGCHRV
jgi:hypothetical protein